MCLKTLYMEAIAMDKESLRMLRLEVIVDILKEDSSIIELLKPYLA